MLALLTTSHPACCLALLPLRTDTNTGLVHLVLSSFIDCCINAGPRAMHTRAQDRTSQGTKSDQTGVAQMAQVGTGHCAMAAWPAKPALPRACSRQKAVVQTPPAHCTHHPALYMPDSMHWEQLPCRCPDDMETHIASSVTSTTHATGLV